MFSKVLLFTFKKFAFSLVEISRSVTFSTHCFTSYYTLPIPAIYFVYVYLPIQENVGDENLVIYLIWKIFTLQFTLYNQFVCVQKCAVCKPVVYAWNAYQSSRISYSD